MIPEQFVKTFRQDALLAEKEKDFSAVALLAQAAWESGWGRFAPGNMFFGVKDTDGINGNEQLVITTEFSRRADLKFPEIIKIEPVTVGGQKLFKYTIKDYFRKYNTPAESFKDHIDFFYRNSRYSQALLHRKDPERFIDEIAKAGYATDPNYAENLKSIAKTIQKFI
jgi:flagellum-specific peptidoglycan hydrolase FlgJ